MKTFITKLCGNEGAFHEKLNKYSKINSDMKIGLNCSFVLCEIKNFIIKYKAVKEQKKIKLKTDVLMGYWGSLM